MERKISYPVYPVHPCYLFRLDAHLLDNVLGSVNLRLALVAARLRPTVLRLPALGRLRRRLRRRPRGLSCRAVSILRGDGRGRLAVVSRRVGRGRDGLCVRVRLRRRVRRRFAYRLGLAARGDPAGEAAQESARLETSVSEYLRRTGAGVLLRSRAVCDDLAVAREFRQARFELVERDVGRALNLRVDADAHVEDEDFILRAQAFELFERDAVGRHLRRGVRRLRARRRRAARGGG